MAFRFPEPGFARSHRACQRPLALVLVAITLSGCSFDLGSLMADKEKPQEEAKPVAVENAVSAGNVSSVPPPAMEFIAPAANAVTNASRRISQSVVNAIAPADNSQNEK